MFTCSVSQSYVKGQFVTIGFSLCVCTVLVLLNNILGDVVCSHY